MSKAMPLFSLVYTSVRPTIIPQVVKLWNERATSGNSIEWVISVDDGDTASLSAANAVKAKSTDQHITVSVVTNTGEKNCNSGWNTAAAASTGKVIIAVADDFVPPQGWDSSLLSLEPKSWPDEDRVIHIDDGFVRKLCTLAILTRKRYEKFGYLFYPLYSSMFNDTEFTEVAYRDGVVIEAMHLLFEHMHPDCNKRGRDTVDLKHASKERWNSGEMLFNFRKSLNFPLDAGPKAGSTSQPEPSTECVYVAYLQVTKDDLCLFETCKRLMEEGVTTFFFAQPDAYWSGEPVEPEAQADVARIVAQLTDAGADCHCKTFQVADYRFDGDDRIKVETRVRNDSLSWIRSFGYERILVVDGDELWMPGTLKLIKPYADQGHGAICTYMYPVIGLPGYPVDTASDVAVVYIGNGVNFKSCRTPSCHQTLIGMPRIYHFTGTRRTMEETIKKHRRGGHYDDPDYLFEEWIEKVLPNIKPGFTHKWPNGQVGLHMYRRYQIWHNLRHWRVDEWQMVPDSLKQYLGAPPEFADAGAQ